MSLKIFFNNANRKYKEKFLKMAFVEKIFIMQIFKVILSDYFYNFSQYNL